MPSVHMLAVRVYAHHVLLKALHEIPYSVWVLTEAYNHGVCYSNEEVIDKKR